MSRAASTEAGAGRRATDRLAADEAGIERAAVILRGGGLVALPTETVYGLGADGRNPVAVAALYEAKGRPRFNPLIAHLPDRETALQEGVFVPDALRLAEAFWPGPLTLVVPVAPEGRVCDLARAGLPSVGLRVPSRAVAGRLLARCGFPVVAPSANRSGRLSPTDAAHVHDELAGRIDAVLDAGPCEVGLESTIVACLEGPPVLLRPGGLAREEIEALLGRPLADLPFDPDRPVAPGALLSHYAPRARVRLDATEIRPGEAALIFGRPSLPGLAAARQVLDLSPGGDLREAAANLFGHLRRLDETGASVIAVTPIPRAGLGEAISDRLHRAAAGR